MARRDITPRQQRESLRVLYSTGSIGLLYDLKAGMSKSEHAGGKG